jgi:carboxymethylenebutenolidase
VILQLRMAFCSTLVSLFVAGLAAATPSPAQAQLNPVEVTFFSGELLLHGFIYKPAGDGPFPAVLWNHGSERRPGWLPELAPLFLQQGYVLFIPHRRGQGRSPGDYVMDVLAQASQGGRDARDRALVEQMELQLEDQAAALAHLKSLPYVDAKRIAVAGCSFGGIQTVLMAEQGLGLRAALDFAGAAQSWSEAPGLQRRMIKAVQSAQMPILFIQAQHDYDLAPSRELAAAMEKAGKPHSLQIFPRFGKTNQDAHEFCVHGGDIWSTQVFSFLKSNLE